VLLAAGVVDNELLVGRPKGNAGRDIVIVSHIVIRFNVNKARAVGPFHSEPSMSRNAVGGIVSSRTETEDQDGSAGKGRCTDPSPHNNPLNVVDIERQRVAVTAAEDLNLARTRKGQDLSVVAPLCCRRCCPSDRIDPRGSDVCRSWKGYRWPDEVIEVRFEVFHACHVFIFLFCEIVAIPKSP
jgi:hypothetical protein